jgi:hypothetical protein
MPQDIVWGDSPELTASAWVLGVPHPTGYPLYLLLTRIMQALPLGTVAFRAHLLSALLTASACTLLYLFLCRILQSHYRNSLWLTTFPALLSVFTFRLTSIVWDQAQISEVYPLFNLLFVSLLMLLPYIQQKKQGAGAFLLFLIGLNLIHHRLAVFLILATGLLWLYLNMTDKSYRTSNSALPGSVSSIYLLQCGCILLLPFLLLLYFPLRATHDPPVNWFDPDTLTQFQQLISGGQYSTILQRGILTLFTYFHFPWVLYCLFLPFMLFSFSGLLALGGFIPLYRRIPWLAVFTLGLYLVYQCFLMIYPVGDWSTFLLPALILLTIPTAFAAAALLDLLQKQAVKQSIIAITKTVLALIALTPLLTTPEISVYQSNWSAIFPKSLQQACQRFALVHFTATTDYATQVWQWTPWNSAIISGLFELTADNEYYPLLYQQVVERRHPDTPIIGSGFLLYDWYREQLNRKLPFDLELYGDRPAASREEWHEDTWLSLVQPLTQDTLVITPSYPLPSTWYPPRARIRHLGKIQMDNSSFPHFYQNYIPSGEVYQISAYQE